MPDTLALRRELEGFATTPSVAMTPFTVEGADYGRGEVRLLFEPRPDFAGTRTFTPTVEMKASYLAPLPIGPVLGVGRVVKAGRTLVFLEGTLSVPGGPPCITATTIVREG